MPNQKSNLSRKGGIVLILGIVGAVVLLLGIGGFLYLKSLHPGTDRIIYGKWPNESPAPISTISPSISNSRFQLDSDNDSVPDFVEQEIGYDPTKDECLLQACQGSNPNNKALSGTNILLILDSSGSMAERAGSEVKMEAAKNAIKNFVLTISPETNLGLMVYGHRGSNSAKDKAVSCQGIELLYPISKLDRASFNTAIDSFKPTGWTAIGGSLLKAKEAFSGLEGQNNRVLIVTDGIETCGSDPVSAATELQSLGIKPTIDVVGFALDAAAKRQLQSVAKVGGGTYYDAQTNSQLADVVKNWGNNISQNMLTLGCRSENFIKFEGCVAARAIKARGYLTQQMVAEKNSSNLVELKKVNQQISDYVNEARANGVEFINRAWSNYRSNSNKIGGTPIK